MKDTLKRDLYDHAILLSSQVLVIGFLKLNFRDKFMEEVMEKKGN